MYSIPPVPTFWKLGQGLVSLVGTLPASAQRNVASNFYPLPPALCDEVTSPVYSLCRTISSSKKY